MWSPTVISKEKTIEIATFTFHEPDTLPKHVRATTVAILCKTGELFIGCAVCSEGEAFVKKTGRLLALREATMKMKRFWKYKTVPGAKIRPVDFIIPTTPDLSTNVVDTKQTYCDINLTVLMLSNHYKTEKFRQMLASRAFGN